MLKFAYQYMRYYKSQTFAIFASILLTAALLAGIGSLMYSSRKNDVENSRAVYGDWHYCVNADIEISADEGAKPGEGFCIEQYGRAQVKRTLSQPYEILFIYADASCREMTHRELIEGREPKAPDEIAADNYTLANLGFEGGVGGTLNLNGEEYILSGIVKGKWDSGADEMEIFVGEEFGADDKTAEKNLLYLKFDESTKLYKQLEAFQRKYHISGDAIEANDGLTVYLSGERPDSIYVIVKFALTDKRGNFTYIILKLQSEYNLAFNGMAALLCLFSLFIIYSVFNISVSKRKAEYAILQTLGVSENAIGGTLIFELWILFLAGYPLGCLLGNGVIAGSGMIIPEAGFHISWSVMLGGFIFLFSGLALAGVLTVRAMRKQTLKQVMGGDVSFIKGSRRIYSKRRCGLANVVVRKFMFSNKKKVAGIILSLSIGSCIFFCTTYMVENLKVHAEMSLKTDDGLGSEYRIFISSDSLADTIPESVVEKIRDISELSEVYGSKYVLGELTIGKERLEWEEYFDEVNKDSYFTERYGGICVDKGNGTYGIKYDVYGYDADMIEQLQDFILEGEVSSKGLEKKNQVIAAANKDGQGNYNFYGLHPGDTVLLRVPKKLNCPPETLRFDGSDADYVEKEFEIAAIVSRPLAKENNYLNVNGWDNAQCFIMTNRQMEDNYGISDYSIINASLVDGADTQKAAGRLLDAVRDVPRAILRDYTEAVRTQKDYLRQQQVFFTGIAGILLVISLFHIMNSMNYSILVHRREYGIIRAMGITDANFYKMILRTGILYGLLTDVFIFLIYNILFRRLMDYYMVHVVQFLHITAEIPVGIFVMVMLLNVLIAVLAVMVPAGKIAAGDIISEIGG